LFDTRCTSFWFPGGIDGRDKFSSSLAGRPDCEKQSSMPRRVRRHRPRHPQRPSCDLTIHFGVTWRQQRQESQRPLCGVETSTSRLRRHRAASSQACYQVFMPPAGWAGSTASRRATAAAHPGIPAIVASDRRERPRAVPASCSAGFFTGPDCCS
jgi:hypothetical protein